MTLTERNARYYVLNTELAKQRAKEWYRNNKARKVAQDKARRHKLKQDVLDKYGNRCNKCGFADTRILQIDHVLANGNIERLDKTLTRYRPTFLRKVLNDTTGAYQLLCPNCNAIKFIEIDKVLQEEVNAVR
jgi:hypothetical protein